MKETSHLPEPGVSVTSHWSASESAGAEVTWGVGAVSRRLDVAASTLRTWERRYRIGPSHRTQGGHRRYTERDIDRVELVRRLVGRGVPAQDAARVALHMDRDALGAALSDEIERGPVDLGTTDLVDALLAAATTRDTDRLGVLVGGLLERGGFLDTWRDVLSPALVRLAREVSTGALEPGAERLAVDLVVRRMRGLRLAGGPARPQVLLAPSTDGAACLPLVALEAALGEAGVATRSLGPEAAPREVADLTARLRPEVVVLWEQGQDVLAPLRAHVDSAEHRTSVLRLSPAWPHEVGVRFGFEQPLVPTDVRGALGHVLDRVS